MHQISAPHFFTLKVPQYIQPMNKKKTLTSLQVLKKSGGVVLVCFLGTVVHNMSKQAEIF